METTPFAAAPKSGVRRASLRGLYLRRLQRLLRLRQQHEQELNGLGTRLLDRSIFAAYCDCRNVGAGEKARAVLHEVNFVVDGPAGLPSATEGGSG